MSGTLVFEFHRPTPFELDCAVTCPHGRMDSVTSGHIVNPPVEPDRTRLIHNHRGNYGCECEVVEATP